MRLLGEGFWAGLAGVGRRQEGRISPWTTTRQRAPHLMSTTIQTAQKKEDVCKWHIFTSLWESGFHVFYYFQKKTSEKLVKPAVFWGNEEPEFRGQGWQQRRKSQRMRYLSPNTNYVKFLKTCIINKWYCTNAFVFSSFSVGSPWDFSLTNPPPSAMLFLSSGCPGSE